MRKANASLAAFLATGRTSIMADLFTITLSDGTVLTWTSHDKDLVIGPYTYSALGPIIDRSKWGIKNVIDVPEMEVIIMSNGSDMPDGSNIKLLAHNGFFDYSTFLLSRVFMPVEGDTSLGTVDLFMGNTAEVTIDDISITLSVKGANHQLAQYMPRNTYNIGCTHSLYDTGCAPNPGQPNGGPSRAANTYTNTVGAGSSTSQIFWGSTAPSIYANLPLGYVTFTSGVNKGTTVGIETATSGYFTLVYPLFQASSVGDTYTVTTGCDRSRGPNGCQFYNNLLHYRGFPYIPPPEYGV